MSIESRSSVMLQASCDGTAGQSECVTTVVKTDWTEKGAVPKRNQTWSSESREKEVIKAGQKMILPNKRYTRTQSGDGEK